MLRSRSAGKLESFPVNLSGRLIKTVRDLLCHPAAVLQRFYCEGFRNRSDSVAQIKHGGQINGVFAAVLLSPTPGRLGENSGPKLRQNQVLPGLFTSAGCWNQQPSGSSHQELDSSEPVEVST